jgi:hypothetical protein
MYRDIEATHVRLKNTVPNYYATECLNSTESSAQDKNNYDFGEREALARWFTGGGAIDWSKVRFRPTLVLDAHVVTGRGVWAAPRGHSDWLM